jgi:CDP-diacylglycerol--serine O-phosphatidyltransferase
MNGMCGSGSIIASISLIASLNAPSLLSQVTSDQIFTMRLAFFLPLLGMFFDFFDGKVARWKNESSMLGQELDSLADLISFGMAPAVLAYVIGLRSFIDKVVLCVFVCGGLARLARFNVTTHLVEKDETGKSKFFQGLPIPTSLALVMTMWYWAEKGMLENGVPLGNFGLFGINVHGFTLVWLLWAGMMTSNTLKVPKL